MSLVGLQFYPENDRDMYEIQYSLDFFQRNTSSDIHKSTNLANKKVYKNLYKSIRKGPIFPTEKWAKDLNRYFTKGDI